MNKIQRLKVTNYKKKLAEKYSFLGVIEISYGDEKQDDIAFCKLAHNSIDGEYFRYGIYDEKSASFSEGGRILSQSKKLIKERINLFRGCQSLIFTANYNSDTFRIKCDVDKFIDHFDEIDDLSVCPIIFEENHGLIISLMRLEYEIELYLWVKKR